VLIIIGAEGFQDEEFGQPFALLKKLGATVKTACSCKDRALGKFGRQVTPDFTLDECRAGDYDAVVFIGGPGASEYFTDARAHALARGAAAGNKVLGAICIAPVILANAGILKDKEATVFPSGEDVLVRAGARLSRKDVVIDGKIVTARGPQAAREFAETLARLMR
jgi:protease I